MKAPIMNGAVHFVSCWYYVACIFRTMVLSTHCISIADYRFCVCACTWAQLYQTFCDPMECSPSGSYVQEISQARILVSLIISFSRGSFQPKDWTYFLVSTALAGRFFTTASPGKFKVKVLIAQLCPTLWDTMDCNPPCSSVCGILQARILEWVTSHSLLQGIFPTWGLNLGLLHCRQILCGLRHQEAGFIVRRKLPSIPLVLLQFCSYW